MRNKKLKSLYLIGSLKNDSIPYLAKDIRKLGISVFDCWHRAGKDADDFWKAGELIKGSSYREALSGYAAQHVYQFDRKHLNRCQGAVLVLPAGKSGHLEAGYMKGSGKWLGIYFPDGEPENTRWDVMYNFADAIIYGKRELMKVLRAHR